MELPSASGMPVASRVWPPSCKCGQVPPSITGIKFLPGNTHNNFVSCLSKLVNYHSLLSTVPIIERLTRFSISAPVKPVVIRALNL